MDYDIGLKKRACARAAVTSTGIGVSFDHAITRPSDDAFRWRLMASDGNDAVEIEARISKSEDIPWETPVLTLQRAMERYAGRFAIESRLSSFAAAAPVYLREQDFKVSDFEHAESWLAP